MPCVCTLIMKVVTGFAKCRFVDVEMVYERSSSRSMGNHLIDCRCPSKAEENLCTSYAFAEAKHCQIFQGSQICQNCQSCQINQANKV